MERTTIRQSYKHPTLCTITVDGYHGHPTEEEASVKQPEFHWRLPNTDPRNEGKYLFRLHTLDIYFWKAEDANSFVSAASSKLHPDQVEVLDAPSNPAVREPGMSSVVQKLENVAIQDPAYRNGQVPGSRTTSMSPSNPALESQTQHGAIEETQKTADPTAFKPAPYNPAAPAAPEPIKHREKTPPPVDGAEGTGLAGAAYRDHAQTPAPPNTLSKPPYTSSQGHLGPQPNQSHTPSYTSATPSVGHTSTQSPQGQRTSSVSSFPPPPPSNGHGPKSPYTPAPSFAPPPQTPQSVASEHSQHPAPTFSAPPQDQTPFYRQDSAPLESPATEILGSSYAGGVRQPLQHLQPQYASYTPSPPVQSKQEPIGGYSDHQYDQQQSQHRPHHQHAQGSEYDVHNQVYRPTLEEASKKKSSKASNTAPATPSGRLEQNAGKVDKKVNSFFKKLEKRVG
ncbi:hypothetical protein ACLMJK_006123 [Lecanora helva]